MAQKRARRPFIKPTRPGRQPVTTGQLPFVRCTLCPGNKKLFYQPSKTTAPTVLQEHVTKHHPEGK